LFNQHFQYLSAYRLPPQESYPRDDYEVQRNRQISIEKGKGELVAHFLEHYQQDQVEFLNLLNSHSPFRELLAQTTAWEREISDHIHVVVSDTGKGFELKYKYDVPNSLPTNEFRAENVGFGITYTLPLIVAMLAAKPGALLLFENPEAHLHPQSQSKLAELMCRCAQNGVQILVETHSDHILNGILVACKRFEQDGQGIDRNLVRIHSFDRDDTTHSTRATEIQVLPGGRIDRQPDGFFDQIEKDMRTILGF
jgi:predicted ATPase